MYLRAKRQSEIPHFKISRYVGFIYIGHTHREYEYKKGYIGFSLRTAIWAEDSSNPSWPTRPVKVTWGTNWFRGFLQPEGTLHPARFFFSAPTLYQQIPAGGGGSTAWLEGSRRNFFWKRGGQKCHFWGFLSFHLKNFGWRTPTQLDLVFFACYQEPQ